MAQTDFDDAPPPTQAELDQMFGSPASKGELIPAQRPPSGREVGGNELLITTQITARHVEAPRNQAAILQELAAIAAYAGNEVLTYRWPVKNRRTGKVDTVIGPTIKCANAIKRVYGNSYTDILVSDQGNFWIFKAIFVDLEKGVQSARLFQQHKGIIKIGGDDDARKLDMAFQVGQSKAIRNVIVDHLELPFVQYMLDVADEKLVEKIARNMDKARTNIASKLADAGIPVVRVERIVGKPINEWSPADVAKVWQELKAVLDNMSDPANVWPVDAPPEPRRTTEQPVRPAEPASAPAHMSDNAQDTGTTRTDMDMIHQDQRREEPQSWAVGDGVVGQDAILLRLQDLVALAKSTADLDAIEEANADRIGRITGNPAASWRQLVRDRRAELAGPS